MIKLRAVLSDLGCALLAVAILASPAKAQPVCAFEQPSKVLLQEGEAHSHGARLLQVWEAPDRPVLWSAAEPDGYAAFRAQVTSRVADTDPRHSLAAAPSANNARVSASADAWIRPARCVQKLLYLEQHRRVGTFDAPTEFTAFVLRSPDGKTLRIYSYTANMDGIGRMSQVGDPVAADHARGWTVLAGLHDHVFHPGDRPDLNGVLAPSLPDAQFNARFFSRTGMRAAWITNGLDTVEIPSSAFSGFEGVDPPTP